MAFDFSQKLEPKDRLVFPLDLPDRASALKYARMLSGSVGFFKVGLELYTKEGPDFIRELRDAAPDAGLFLDLKFHDIPETAGRAVKSALALKPDLLTVHAQGGEAMLRRAKESAGAACVLAVTLLTSLMPSDLSELKPEYQKPGAYALLLAERAKNAGCGGIVASSLELKTLRGRLGPEMAIAVPGIRPSWASVENDDQARVGTPLEALASGATLLVVGRPIRDAEDPLKAAERTLEEMSGFKPPAPPEKNP